MNSVVDHPGSKHDPQLGSLTWWSRLRSALLPAGRSIEDQSDGGAPPVVVAVPLLIPAAETQDRRSVTASVPDASGRAGSGLILPFPIHGEALLVKVGDVLRSRCADSATAWKPLLQMSRCPRSRLSIDRDAYIEFHQDRGEYRAVFEASQATRVILETADFDDLVDFILRYVTGRMAEPAALEAAS
jgi:hypothetical protein